MIDAKMWGAVKPRYVVRPCDDAGTLGSGGKARAWGVFDTRTNRIMSNWNTRRQARAEAQVLNKKVTEA